MSEKEILEAFVWFGAAAATVLVPYGVGHFLHQRWLCICAAFWAAIVLLAFLFADELGVAAVRSMSVIMTILLAISGVLWAIGFVIVCWLIPAIRWLFRHFPPPKKKRESMDFFQENSDFHDFNNFAG